jgi:hypothetical protein
MVLGSLSVVFILVRLPRLQRRDVGVFEFVWPTAAGVFLIFVGAGIAELGLDPSGAFAGSALVKFAAGASGFVWLAVKLFGRQRS